MRHRLPPEFLPTRIVQKQPPSVRVSRIDAIGAVIGEGAKALEKRVLDRR